MKNYLYHLVERIAWSMLQAVNNSDHVQDQLELDADDPIEQCLQEQQSNLDDEDNDQGRAW